MSFAREPRFHPVAIDDLRPTQLTVGMREVDEKRARWRAQPEDKKADFLGSHFIPVVLGPDKTPYVIDHHHLARALHEEGVKDVAVTVIADLSGLEPSAFWFYLDNRAWTFLYDAAGERQTRKDLPKHIKDMADDPFRSLAGELRRAGGFAKEVTPFSEFLWADFLRRRITRKQAAGHPESALEEALRLAKSQDAAYLPGWCGPVAAGDV
jgi:hypothetical protein